MREEKTLLYVLEVDLLIKNIRKTLHQTRLFKYLQLHNLPISLAKNAITLEDKSISAFQVCVTYL